MDVNIIEIIKTLNITDWIIVGIFAISVIYGGIRGLFKEMGALIIWVVAFFVAWTFYGQFSVMLAEYIPNNQIRSAASVIILILAVILVGSILNMFLSFLINKAGLGGIDKIFGLFFGLVRAGLLVGIAAHMCLVLHLSNNPFIAKSVLLKKLAPYGEWVYEFIPENMRNTLEGNGNGNKLDKNPADVPTPNAKLAASTAPALVASSSATVTDTNEASAVVQTADTEAESNTTPSTTSSEISELEAALRQSAQEQQAKATAVAEAASAVTKTITEVAE